MDPIILKEIREQYKGEEYKITVGKKSILVLKNGMICHIITFDSM